MSTPDASPQRLSVRVTGRVQGVYFRAFTRRHAQKLGLAGWVRNEYDGSVRLEAEGPRVALERFLYTVRQGPPGARVDQAEVEWTGATGAYHGFAVRF